MQVQLTDHAHKRLCQRGVPLADLTLLLRHAWQVVRHGGCELLTLGRTGERQLIEAGESRQVVDRLKRTAVVLATDECRVVTVLKLKGRAGRRYRLGN